MLTINQAIKDCKKWSSEMKRCKKTFADADAHFKKLLEKRSLLKQKNNRKKNTQ
jgi:hypothetical protein